jgi:hypothetical protein
MKETTEAIHAGRKGGSSEAAFAGEGAQENPKLTRAIAGLPVPTKRFTSGHCTDLPLHQSV